MTTKPKLIRFLALLVLIGLTVANYPMPPRPKPPKGPGCPSSCRPEWGCYCA